MKEEPRTAVKHEFEHETPTVIHHPEEDMTALARWFRHGMQQGPKFWIMIAGVLGLFVVVPLLMSGLSSGESPQGKAWSELILATTPGQKAEVADEHATGEVAIAARLQAASGFFSNAVRALPNENVTAKADLKRALELFQQVQKDAPQGSTELLRATQGAARTLEARNELADAITQYKAISAGWPGTPEAKHADRLIKELQDPDVIAFYKQLHEYKPPTAPLPSTTGLGGLPPNLSLPPNHPSLDGPTVPTGPLAPPTLPGTGLGPLDIAPPPMPETKSAAPAVTPAPAAAPVAKPAAPAAATSAPVAKPAAATPAPAAAAKPAAPTAKPELPADPFKPAAKP
jgi:hypothetical protein